jgi:putative nucleotidyltransferase with HDIG domain
MLEELIETAKEFERAGAWDDALACYERGLRSLSRESSPATAADLLRWIGTVRRERGELELAREVYDVSLAIAELNGLAHQTAAVLNCMAIVEHLRGQVEDAEELYTRALDQAVSLDDQRLAAMLDQNLGALQGLRGNLQGALRSYQSALTRSERLQDQGTAVRAMNNMGMAYLRLGDLAAAESSLSRALALAETTGDRLMTGTLELNRAGLHLQGGRHDIARACCDRSIDVFGSLKSKQWTAEAYKLSGVLHREMGECDQADACFTVALGLAEVAQNRLLQAEAQMEWAIVHLTAARNEQGIFYLNQALRLFTEMSAQREVGDIRERLEAVEDLYLPAVHQWSAALMASTGQGNAGHASRVADFSCRLGEMLGLEGWGLTVLRVGALLHDIGYTALIGTTEVPAEAAPEAHPLLKVHTIAGDAIARRLSFPAEVCSIVRHHHEWWDGTGFPDRLRGEEIPLATRIVAVADAFDRLVHPTGQQPRLTATEAYAHIRGCGPNRFDPDVVEGLVGLGQGCGAHACAA